MKKILALALALIMVFSMVACGGPKEPQISVFWYDESDVYLSSVRTALNAELDKLGIKYDNQFAANDQAKQLDRKWITAKVGNIDKRSRWEAGCDLYIIPTVS